MIRVCRVHSSARFCHRINRRKKGYKMESKDIACKSDDLDDVSVNIPGLQFLYKENVGNARRFFWVLLLIACTVICVYQGINRFCLFLSEPVEKLVVITRNETIMFPTFTICPFDIDNLPEIRRFQMKFKDISEGKTSESVWYLLDFTNLTNEQIWDLNRIDEENTKVEYKMKKKLPMTKPISKLLLNGSLAYLGTCMSVTTVHEMDFMGPAFVLRIEQDIPNDVFYDPDYPAFTIYAHAKGVPIKHHAFFKGTIILRGHMTTMALSVTKFKNLNRSNFVCTNIIRSASCWTDCIEGIITENVNCSLPYMVTKTLPNCNTSSESNATYCMTQNIYLTAKEIDCQCPNACVEDSYDLDIDVQGFLENKTILEIYFPRNTFEIIEERYWYDFVALICDLGGNLGFYLGVSLLTMLEILDLFFVRCKKLSKIRRNVSVIQHVNL